MTPANLIASTPDAELYEFPDGDWVIKVDAAHFRVESLLPVFMAAGGYDVREELLAIGAAGAEMARVR
jgi:hypothetical protein